MTGMVINPATPTVNDKAKLSAKKPALPSDKSPLDLAKEQIAGRMAKEKVASLRVYRACCDILAADKHLSEKQTEELAAAMNLLGVTVRAIGEDVEALKKHRIQLEAIAANRVLLAEAEKALVGQPEPQKEIEELRRRIREIENRGVRVQSCQTMIAGHEVEAARLVGAHPRVLGTEEAALAPPPQQPAGMGMPVPVIRSGDR